MSEYPAKHDALGLARWLDDEATAGGDNWNACLHNCANMIRSQAAEIEQRNRQISTLTAENVGITVSNKDLCDDNEDLRVAIGQLKARIRRLEEDLRDRAH